MTGRRDDRARHLAAAAVTGGRAVGLLRLLVSGGLLALLFWRGGVDPQRVLESISQARPGPLAGAVLLYAVVGSVVRGFRWQALVAALGQPIHVARTTELFLVGTFFNQLLPTGIGGDVVRTLILARDGLGRARAASTVLVDRAVGVLMLLAAGLVALAFTFRRAPPALAALLLVAGGAGAAGSLVLLFAHRVRGRAESIPFIGRLAALDAVTRFVDSFAEYGWRPLALSAAWSTVFTGLLIASNVLIARSLGIESVGLVDWALVVPLVALSSLAPAVGGWGVREGAYTVLLGAIDTPVDGEKAFAIAVLFGGMNLMLAAVGGLLAAAAGSVAAPGRADGVENGGAE